MNGHEIKLINRNAKHQQDLLQHRDGICRTIPAGTHGSTPHLLKTVVNDTPLRIRKLTPKECWRLMGFDDADFENAEKVNSNTQLYKQARKLNRSKCARSYIKEFIRGMIWIQAIYYFQNQKTRKKL